MSLLQDLTKLREMGQKKKKTVAGPGLLHFFRIFGRHYRKYWQRLSGSGVSLLISISVVVLEPWPVKIILDYILFKEPLPENLFFLHPYMDTDPRGMLIAMAGAIVLLALIQALFSCLNKFRVSVPGGKMTADIRERVFSRVQQQSPAFHESSSTLRFWKIDGNTGNYMNCNTARKLPDGIC